MSLCAERRAGGRRAAWLNRDIWLELRGKKKVGLLSLEYEVGSSGGLQGCHEVMQGENLKGQKPARAQSGYCHTRRQKHFYKYISKKRRAKENLHPLLGMEDKEKRLSCVMPSSHSSFAITFAITTLLNSKTSCSSGTSPLTWKTASRMKLQ